MVDRPRLDLVGMLALLVVVNLLTVVVLDGWASALLQAVAAGGAVAIALASGYSADDLALSSRTLGAGARLGAITAAIIAGGVALIAIVPFSRAFLDDDRFADMAGSEILYQVGFRIPVITALTEELLFRAVLLAILLQLMSIRWAVVISAGVFGLWHVLTTIGDLDGNEATESLNAIARVGSVAVVVVVTAVAGLLFGWLRVRSGSVVAPWFAHIAFNAATFVAGVIVVGRGWT